MCTTLATCQVFALRIMLYVYLIYLDCTINKVSIRARPRSTRRTVIRFSSDNVNATYKCSLNGNTFSKCKCTSMFMQLITAVLVLFNPLDLIY